MNNTILKILYEKFNLSIEQSTYLLTIVINKN